MGTGYIDIGGSADNSGSTDQNSANLTGTTATRLSAGLIQLDIGTNLSAVDATPGSPTQSTINIAGATNANQTIFWIIGKDDALDQVTVTPDPTGMTTNAWKIGGRFFLGPTGTPANARIEAALRAGDTFIWNNTPSAQAAVQWTFRNAGDATSGYAKIMGKAGVYPTLNVTNTSNGVTSAFIFNWIEGFTIDQDGASGSGVAMSAGSGVVYNNKIIDAGGNGISFTSVGAVRAIGNEISGTGGDGISAAVSGIIYGNYIHDVAGNGITCSQANATLVVVNNIIDTPAGRGIIFSAATTAATAMVAFVYGNTLYNSGNSGFEVTDGDTTMTLIGNIFSNNGNAAGEANVEWAAGNAEILSIHGWNVLFNGSGADAPINFTVNASIPASEFTTDPLMTDPANGNFTIAKTSPAFASNYPGQLLGVTGAGYLDMGALQRIAGGMLVNPGMSGGVNG